MKNYKEILEGVVNIINTTEKSDIGFANICAYISENCSEIKENEETNAPTEYGKYVDECLNEAAKHFFSEGKDKYTVADLFYAGIKCKEDWLKKQSEQKSNPYSGVSFKYNGHIWGICARDGGIEISYDKQLIGYLNLPQEKDEFDNLSKAIDNKLTNCNTGDFIMSTAPNRGI